MAASAKQKRKVFFVLGGRGLSPDVDFKKVGGGRFTKRSRGLNAKKGI